MFYYINLSLFTPCFYSSSALALLVSASLKAPTLSSPTPALKPYQSPKKRIVYIKVY